MRRFDNPFLYLLLFCWLTIPLFGQENQRFSVLITNHFSSTFQKEDSFFQPNSAYGNGLEFRYKIGDNNDQIKTLIGLAYHRINFEFFADLPPTATTKTRHHILSVPMYLWANISDEWYLHYHLSFDVPIRTKERFFDGNRPVSNRTIKHKFNVNAGLGAGINLGHYFEVTEKYSLFGELFFKAPSILAPLSSDENFYMEHGFRPYILGLNGGIRF